MMTCRQSYDPNGDLDGQTGLPPDFEEGLPFATRIADSTPGYLGLFAIPVTIWQIIAGIFEAIGHLIGSLFAP